MERISKRWFVAVFIIGLIAQAVPAYLTRQAPAWDGQMVAGFPLSFYSFGGGLCGVKNHGFMQCPPWFRMEDLFIDLIFVLIVAGMVAFAAEQYALWKSRRPKAGRR